MKTKLLICLMLLAPLGASAQDAHWQCDPHAFEYDMTVNLALYDGDTAIEDASDYELAAFVGDECRGVAEFISVQENSYGYLRVRSNQTSGEEVSFKVFKKSWNKELPVNTEAIDFKAQSKIGQPSSPLSIVFRSSYIINLLTDTNKGSVVGGGTIDFDTETTVKAEPAAGYHFSGWSNGVTDNPYTFTVNQDMELTALFEPNSYTMTFVKGNGEEDVQKTQDFGTALSVPDDPTMTGFTFKGWSPEIPTSIPASDQTFTAQWERNSYKVTFIADGKIVSEQTLEYDSSITAPEAPEKEGHTFSTWGDVAATVPAADVTYTATYTVNQYKVTFIADGETVSEQVLDYGTAITAPEAPEKEGHTFSTWGDVAATVPAADVTYTATYTVNQYKVTFIADGETVSEQVLDYGTAISAPEAADTEIYTLTPRGALAVSVPAADVTYIDT